MPSFSLEMLGQTMPDSQLWYYNLSQTPTLYQTRVALLAQDVRKEITSQSGLKDCIDRLAKVMRINPAAESSPPLYTSLCIAAHGNKETGEIKCCGQWISLKSLVEQIRNGLPEAFRPFLCHIHFDACFCLEGLSHAPLPDLTISGYTIDVGIACSRAFYECYIVPAVRRAAQGGCPPAIREALASTQSTLSKLRLPPPKDTVEWHAKLIDPTSPENVPELKLPDGDTLQWIAKHFRVIGPVSDTSLPGSAASSSTSVPKKPRGRPPQGKTWCYTTGGWIDSDL